MKDEPLNQQPADSRTSILTPFVVAIFCLAAIWLIGINLLSNWLNEAINLNPAIAEISNYAVPLLACIVIGLYLILRRRGAVARLAGFAILLVPIAFFTLVEPVFNGDGRMTRLQPRFFSTAKRLPTQSGDQPLEEASLSVDLKTTTRSDFSRFLGPNANGTIRNVRLLDWDGRSPEILWKQPIGKGWSGFAAVNGYAVTQEQRQDKECVTCYSIDTGEIVWINSTKRRHEDTMGMGKPGPRATPTIVDGNVYAVSATGVLDCLDGRDGSKIWSVDVPAMVGITQKVSVDSRGLEYTEEDSTLAWGRATSPLVVNDWVIVPVGGPADAPDTAVTMAAFDKSTGEVVWKGGNRNVAYGSPILATIGGTQQILLIAEDHAVGHDLETGRELWAFYREGNSNMAANCSQVTVISDSQLLFSKGYGLGGELVDVTVNSEGIWQAESVKKDPRILKTKLTSPVVFEGHLYSLSDGYLECVAIDGLKKKWKQRGRFENGQILLVRDRLLVHSETGTLILAEANPEEFVELGRLKTIKGICWNTLCLYGDQLLVRSDLEAACIRIPVEQVDAAGEPQTNRPLPRRSTVLSRVDR